MEVNAARLGLDPEEMYKPILKPVRTTWRAGGAGIGRFRNAHRENVRD